MCDPAGGGIRREIPLGAQAIEVLYSPWEGESFHKFFLEFLFQRQLNMLHCPCNPICFFSFISVHQRQIGAVSCRVSYDYDIFRRAVWEEPYGEGIFLVDMQAEGTGDDDPVYGIYLEMVHEYFAPGLQGGFRELDLPYVLLGENNVTTCSCFISRNEKEFLYRLFRLS